MLEYGENQTMHDMGVLVSPELVRTVIYNGLRLVNELNQT